MVFRFDAALDQEARLRGYRPLLDQDEAWPNYYVDRMGRVLYAGTKRIRRKKTDVELPGGGDVATKEPPPRSLIKVRATLQRNKIPHGNRLIFRVEYMVKLKDLGRPKNRSLARIVASTFVAGYSPGATVRFKDGCPENFRAANLYWEHPQQLAG